MKKIIIIPIILFALFWSGCEKESFDVKMFNVEDTDIDSVYLSAGARTLIADGHASLKFAVETFRTATFTKESGETFDTLVHVDHNLLPTGALKIFDSNGTEVGMEYSTTDFDAGSKEFYAQVNNVQSDIKTVVLREPQVLPEKRYINVVFHVFELKSSSSHYDQLTYQALDPSLLEEAIMDANNVFNNKLGDNANGASANIEFRLAEKGKYNNVLTIPGYNKYSYDEAIIPEPNYSWQSKRTSFYPSDFVDYVNEKSYRLWKPEEFLNIFVIPVGASTSMSSGRPRFQLVDSLDLNPMEGMGDLVTSIDDVDPYKFSSAGCAVPRTLFFATPGVRINLARRLASFYGLYSTAISEYMPTDYCTDTNLHDSSGQYNDLIKRGVNGDLFYSDNATDDERYISLRNTLTLDQVERVRYALENCPYRRHGTAE
jgi:hypothetical protein